MGTAGKKLAAIIELEGEKYYPIVRAAEANARILFDLDPALALEVARKNCSTFGLWANDKVSRPDSYKPKTGELVLEVKEIETRKYLSENSVDSLADMVRISHAALFIGVNRNIIAHYIDDGIFTKLWMPGGKIRYVSAKEIHDPERIAMITSRMRWYHGGKSKSLLATPKEKPAVPKVNSRRVYTAPESPIAKENSTVSRKPFVTRIPSPRYDTSTPLEELPPRYLGNRLMDFSPETDKYFCSLLQYTLNSKTASSKQGMKPMMFAVTAVRQTLSKDEQVFIMSLYEQQAIGVDGENYQNRRRISMQKVVNHLRKMR